MRQTFEKTVTLDERQQTVRGIGWLEPLADDAVKGYLADKRANPTTAALLKAAWEIRQVLYKATNERQKLTSEEGDLRRAQTRSGAERQPAERARAVPEVAGLRHRR